jgi:hypothetical protein
VATALLAGLLPSIPVATTTAAEGIAMPFPGGQAVRIIQGYNGGTHRGRSQYALDLVLADGETSGAEVVSPIEGTVSWAQGPGAGNGCMAVASPDGAYSVTLCHVIFSRAFSRGESITRGQTLGKVGPAGAVGNNGAPHVHLDLQRGGRASGSVPFSPPDGLPLEGVALAATGSYNEHGRRDSIVSTNRPGRGAVLAAATLPQPAAAVAAPSSQARSGASSTAAAATPATTTPATTRAAVVRGTESCLNVREKPSARAARLGCLDEGTAVKVVEGPTTAEGFSWYRIERAQPADKGGWVVGQYLE